MTSEKLHLLRKKLFLGECRSKVGTAFQDFFENIMKLIHPNFIAISSGGGDWKSDGLLRNHDTVFAVYSPEQLKVSRNATTLKKIEEDCNGAKEHWPDMKKWIFVYNYNKWPPGTDKLVKTFSNGLDIDLWDQERLWQECSDTLANHQWTELLGAEAGSQELEDSLQELPIGFKSFKALIDSSDQDIPTPFRGLQTGIPKMVDFENDFVIRPSFVDDMYKILSIDKSDKTKGNPSYFDMLMVGPAGTGKTWASLSIGYELLKNNWHVLYANMRVIQRHGLQNSFLNLVLRQNSKCIIFLDDVHLFPNHTIDIIEHIRHHALKFKIAIRIICIGRTSEKGDQEQLRPLLSLFVSDKALLLKYNTQVAEDFYKKVREHYNIHRSFQASKLFERAGNMAIFCEVLRRLAEESDGLTQNEFDPWNELEDYVISKRLEGISDKHFGGVVLGAIAVFSKIDSAVTIEFLRSIFGDSIDDIIRTLIDLQQVWKRVVPKALLQPIGLPHSQIAEYIFKGSTTALGIYLKLGEQTVESFFYKAYFEYIQSLPGNIVGIEDDRFLHLFSNHLNRIEDENLIEDFYNILVGRKNETTSEMKAISLFNFGVYYYKENVNTKAIDAYTKSLETKGDFHFVWHNLGTILFIQEEYAKAEQHFEKAIELNEKDALPYVNLSAVYSKQNRACVTLFCAKTATALDPNHAGAWHNLGRAYRMKNDNQSAQVCYEKAHTLDPENADAWAADAETLVSLERYSNARNCVVEASREGHKTWNLFLALGSALIGENRIKDALKWLAQSERLRPDEISPKLKMAEAYTKIEEYAKAKTKIEEALKIDSESSQAIGTMIVVSIAMDESFDKYLEKAFEVGFDDEVLTVSIVKALLLRKHTQDANRITEILLNKQTENSTIMTNLAKINFDLKNKDMARTVCEKAIQFDEYIETPHYILARLEYEEKKYENASHYCRTILEKNPDNIKARKLLGSCLENFDQLPEAIAEFKIVLESNEKDKYSLERLGIIYLTLEQWDASLPIWERLNRIFKNHPGYLNNYGKALVELERFEEALKVFDRTSRLEKSDMRGFSNLGNVLQKLERYKQAESAYRRGLKLDPDNTVLLGALITLLPKMGKIKELDELKQRHHQASLKLTEDYKKTSSEQGFDENWT